MSTLTKMLKNFISFEKISHFICNFISLICSFQQCQCCECGNVSMGFWKSRVKQKSFVKSLVCDSWLNKTFVSLVISKTPYSHFLLTAFTQCTHLTVLKKCITVKWVHWPMYTLDSTKNCQKVYIEIPANKISENILFNALSWFIFYLSTM